MPDQRHGDANAAMRLLLTVFVVLALAGCGSSEANESGTIADEIETAQTETGSDEESSTDDSDRDSGTEDPAKTSDDESDSGESDTGEPDSDESETDESDSGESDTDESDSGESDSGESDPGDSDDEAEGADGDSSDTEDTDGGEEESDDDAEESGETDEEEDVGEIDPDDIELNPEILEPDDKTSPSVAPPGSGVYDVSLEPLVQQAMADLESRLGVEQSNMSVHSAAAMTWPDSSAGCPKPGMAYAQVLTEGTEIVLMVDGTTYRYTTGGGSTPTLCEA